MSTVGPGLPPLSPTREEFHALAGRGNLVPVFAELAADLDTPLSAFLRLRPGPYEEEDARLADEMRADPKERAEHVMLVDVGRNDVGRVSRLGSVEVSEFMVVERYSHVMHLVSHVRGRLEPGKDAFDVLAACFPAGTLTGAPKIRAMEIIEELEPTRRGPYGGAVGYISYSGNLDSCITIRTVVCHGRRASPVAAPA